MVAGICITIGTITVGGRLSATALFCRRLTIQASVYDRPFRNECQGYSSYQQEIGTCDTSAASTSCVTQSPATQEWMAHAQSYKITQCATSASR